MKKTTLISCILLIAIIFSLPVPSHAKERTSFVNDWISAMMNNGEGLNAVITPDFEYTHYSFEFKKRLYRGEKGDIPFFAKTSKPDEIVVEEIRPGSGGSTVAILQATASGGLYRAWEIRLFILPSGISKVTEIAKEGTFEGYPPGCPETAFKRDLVVTLHGTPEGFTGEKEIKLYLFRRDTDIWDYAHPGVDEKMFKYCSPRPDTFTTESEVVVFDQSAQIEAADTVAAKHKAEKDEEAFGAVFFEDDGINYPGRLFDIGGGKEGLMLTFTLERGEGDKTEEIVPARLFVWKGGGWKSIWGFDAGFGSMSGALGDAADRAEWSIRSQADAGSGPAITAQLESNDDKNFKCPLGTTIIFNKKGAGFKPEKGGIPGACFRKHTVSDAALRAHIKEDKGPTYHGEVQEIDWMFQR